MPDEPSFDRSDESLLYAFSSLLGRLNITANMQQLREELIDQDLNFESLAEGEHVHIVERGEYGSWPTSNNAIIKFQFQDQEQPYIELEDGSRDANIIDHYCLVADYEHRTVIDSANGAIKEGSQFGQPVSWAMFEAGSAPKSAQPKIDEARSYRVLKGGESGWAIARKLGIEGIVLKEHNEDDVTDFDNLPEGTILHLPIKIEERPKSPITEFEFMRRPLEMHVSKAGGTRKHTFGNPKDPQNIKETGPRHAENKNLSIFAIAHVPVNEEIVTYYMESTDVDVKRKKVKWTVGFRADDLEEGHVEPQSEEYKPSPEIQAQLDAKMVEAEQRKQMIDDVNEQDVPPSKRMGSDSVPTVEAERLKESEPKDMSLPENNPYNWWKTTYKPLNEDRKPEVFLFNQDIVVADLDGKCKNKWLRRLDGVRIAGTFTGPDHRTYYRPQDAMDLFTWYGIPQVDPETGEPVLTPEDEIFNTNLPLAERAAIRHGRLSKVERYFTVPLAKATARSPWLQRYASKVKQNKE